MKPANEEQPPELWRDKCTNHRVYKGKRRPKCGCRACWAKWTNTGLKLFIVGHGRHGKDTAGDFLARKLELRHTSSSHFAADKVVRPWLAEKYDLHYSTLEECFEDRGNHRMEWREAIESFNKKDPSALSKAIFAEFDTYQGIRSRREFLASKGLASLSIWIDASERCDDDPSCDILEDDCDITVRNNGSLSAFLGRLDRLASLLKTDLGIRSS